MDTIPPAIETAFAAKLDKQDVPVSRRPEYRKWLRFYLDFCRKHRHRTRDPETLPRFLEKFAAKGQSEGQQQDATAVEVVRYRRWPTRRRVP